MHVDDPSPYMSSTGASIASILGGTGYAYVRTAHGRHLFMLRLPGGREPVLESLAAAGITRVSPGYVPLHRNAAVLRDAKAITTRLGQPYPEANCPNADQVSTDTIWLPQPYLLGTESQTRSIATTITEAVAS
jgi:dTDP-4-amino-4,6-dideoxygalactose transaminase